MLVRLEWRIGVCILCERVRMRNNLPIGQPVEVLKNRIVHCKQRHKSNHSHCNKLPDKYVKSGFHGCKGKLVILFTQNNWVDFYHVFDNNNHNKFKGS